jgi:hypothetical protein
VHPADRSTRPRRPVAALALALTLLGAAPAAAQTNPAIDLLRRAHSARARARAAEALGRLRPAGCRAALEAALDDRAAAVRVASARALEALGDPAATPALDAHALDRDARARAAVVHARRALQHGAPVALASAWTTGPAASPLPGAAPSQPAVASAAVDWRRVRVLITLGPLANNVTTDAAHVGHLREALRLAVGADDRYAIHPGALPSAVALRLRRGSLRAYTIEGALTALNEGAAGPRLSVRAEVSLLLVLEPSHSIAATLSGSATAQDVRPSTPGLRDPMPLLRQRAIEGAATGALRSLESQLLASR